MWFFFLLARESLFKTRFQFLFLILICVLKDAATTIVCEMHVHGLSGTLRPWFFISASLALSQLWFFSSTINTLSLLHFSSELFCFLWSKLIIPQSKLIIYSVFWLCFGLQGNGINWKTTGLRWRSKYPYLRRNIISMEHDDWWHWGSLRLTEKNLECIT